MQQGKDRVRPGEGDIIVTAVGDHYAIGRLKANGEMQEYLQSQPNRAVALKQACALAGANHRVALYPSAGTPDYLPVGCVEVVKSRTTTGTVKKTNGSIKRDVAALIKQSHGLRHDAEELHRTADELLRKA